MDNQGKKYDAIAEGFAKMRDSFYKEQRFLDELIKLIPAKSTILDVGCGSGVPIASYFIEKDFEVTGIDGSQKLLDIAKEKCPKMKGVLGDVRSVILNEQFDAVVEWWCLFHIPKPDHEKMIQRFSQWLKPNGILEFTSGDAAYEATFSDMLNQELHYYSLEPSQYELYLKKHGFKLILKESDQPDHLVWIAQKVV
ncbi:MAG: class I SAM-dependent methyltransferase [Proteobacteria bacterium]|nr:class I SAM-dependent methyltransferase [Pseudomonadota bacterium]